MTKPKTHRAGGFVLVEDENAPDDSVMRALAQHHERTRQAYADMLINGHPPTRPKHRSKTNRKKRGQS